MIKSRRLFGFICAVLVACVWSGWVVVSRLGMTSGFTVIDISLLRYATAGFLALPFSFLYWPNHLNWKKILILAMSGGGLTYAGAAYAGMLFSPASHAAIVMNGLLPIVVLFVNVMWLKIKPSISYLFVALSILIGCSIILFDQDISSNILQLLFGSLLFFVAAFQLGFYMVAGHQWKASVLNIIAIVPLINAIIVVPLYFLLPNNLANLPVDSIIIQAAYQAIGPSLLGLFCLYSANIYLGRGLTATIMASVPILSTLIAIPVLNEWPGLPTWLGLIIVTSAILANVYIEQKHSHSIKDTLKSTS